MCNKAEASSSNNKIDNDLESLREELALVFAELSEDEQEVLLNHARSLQTPLN